MNIETLKKILCLVLIVFHTHSEAKPFLHHNRTVNISGQPSLNNPENRSLFHQASPDNSTDGMSRPRLIPALIASAVVLIRCIYAYCKYPRDQMVVHPAGGDDGGDDDDDVGDDGFGIDLRNARSNRAYFSSAIFPKSA